MGQAKTQAQYDSILAEILGTDRFKDLHEVDWPFRPGTKIAFRLLTDEETESCELAAHAYVRSKQMGGGDLAAWLAKDHKALFDARYSREVLVLALCRPGSGEPAVTSIEQLSRLIGRPELDALIGLYNDYAETMAPSPSQIQSEEEFEKLAMALRGPFDETLLNRCRPSTLRQFAHYLANHWTPRPPKSGKPSAAPSMASC